MRRVLLCVQVAILAGCARSPWGDSHPLTPEEALNSFTTSDDFRIELFAAEPHVRDPVEMVFDERGRAFVAEMLDYPFDPSAGQPPKSRIRLVEDTNGDGRVDRSTIFADQLQQVTSLQPWKGGLLVTAAPDIIYLKDTDGDQKADVRRVLFTGFSRGDPQHRVTSIRFWIDNWFYVANDGQPGEIRSTERPDDARVSVLGSDFRFRPDRGLFEAASGPAQFGQTSDEWGRRFITHNTIHVRHVMFPRHYLARNVFLPAGQPAHDISDHDLRMFQITAPEAWRETRTRMRQERYDEQRLGRTEHATGFFTAASGGTIYTGDTFPEKYHGNLFTGEVSGNLVHRDILQPHGATFVASRPGEERTREFLASTDRWFRPCSFAIGPDGHLYLVDMYREFIESPEYIPEPIKRDMNFYSGTELGRIYRIVPRHARTATAAAPDLATADAAALARALSHPNQWWRLTAQRLLLERQDRAAVPILRETALRSDASRARLHALYALEGLSALDSTVIRAALESTHPGIREHAVRLAEDFPPLSGKLTDMIDDPSPRVRFQLALSLGAFADPRTLRALASLASRHGQDQWFRKAILSSRSGSTVALLELMIRERVFFQQPDAERRQFLGELATIIGARNEAEEIVRLLVVTASARELADETWQVASLSGLAAGLELANLHGLKARAAEAVLKRLLSRPSATVRSAARRVARHFEMADLVAASARQALDPNLAVSERQLAVHSLTSGDFGRARPVFEQLLAPHVHPVLQEAALAALAAFEASDVSDLILARWRTFSPALRLRALDRLLSHRLHAAALIAALEDGRVSRDALDPARRQKLLEHPEAAVRARAAGLFREAAGKRAMLVAKYRAALGRAGESAQGEAVFKKLCASCHWPRDGRLVGPDLAGVSNKSKEQLLEAILSPSSAISPAYTNYIIVTADGRIHDGVIVAETPGAITLRREREEETVLRSKVAEIRASGLSIMPDGLEQAMSEQDLADLLAFLRAARVHRH